MPWPHDPLAPAWADDAMPCAVIDIQSELRFWEDTYLRQPFRRAGMPFRRCVPTLKFAYDTYLLSHRRSLQALLPSLPVRYEACILRGLRLDWPLAHTVIACVWERLNAPLEEDPPLFPLIMPGAMEERALLAEAMRHR